MNNNMDGRYHNVSLRLYEVLDSIGVSEDLRRKWVETGLVREILQTAQMHLFDLKTNGAYYIFGSSSEGTTTYEMDSDIDTLYCFNVNVMEIISDELFLGVSFLMVNDESIKPGYVKLQVVQNQVPHTIHLREPNKYEESDHLGRICAKHVDVETFFPFTMVKHGPAHSRVNVKGSVDQDLVPAFRYHRIPSFAQSWITRRRTYNWPSQTQLDEMQESGCFFVGVNHPSCQNGPIEWRLSFSLQERLLMYSVNSTQHKCYVLLKIIKKDIIQKLVRKSISSYHCKTCVFYAIEHTPCDFWTPVNILECTLFCIKLLLQWVKENNCPNYFIPNENMFDRIGHRTLRRVQIVLKTIIGHWCECLWSLKCDRIGSVLYDAVYGSGFKQMISKCISTTHTSLFVNDKIMSDLLIIRMHILKRHTHSCGDEILLKFNSYIDRMRQTERLTDHTSEITGIAFSYIYPHLHLQAAQCVASIMLATNDEDEVAVMFDTFKTNLEESKHYDTLSMYLIKASYYLQTNRSSVCMKLLLDCEDHVKPHVLSACSCSNLYKGISVDHEQLLTEHYPSLFTDFARTCSAVCMLFPPTQANLVPSALHYEMYRSVFTPPESRDEDLDVWFDWIAVDSKVYLFFLQYIVFSKTNKPINKRCAKDNLVRIIHTDKNLGHKETAYNLLGWIYRQEGRIHQAMECFLKSWRIRPNHNAAKWHLFLLMFGEYKKSQWCVTQ